jgi:hypothetical protein
MSLRKHTDTFYRAHYFDIMRLSLCGFVPLTNAAFFDRECSFYNTGKLWSAQNGLKK